MICTFNCNNNSRLTSYSTKSSRFTAPSTAKLLYFYLSQFFIESAEHLAHFLAWMISEQLTVDDVLTKPFYHPTLEEGLRTALKHARRQLNSI